MCPFYFLIRLSAISVSYYSAAIFVNIWDIPDDSRKKKALCYNTNIKKAKIYRRRV